MPSWNPIAFLGRRARAARTSDARPGAGRGVVEGSLLGAGVVLAAALLVLVNYLGWKYHQRFDWTEAQLYSLSDTTEQVLAALDRDVEAVAFLPPGSPLYEPTRELLARYEAASGRLSVTWLDPERNPVEAERLAERYEIASTGVVFVAGDERRAVPADRLAEVDFSAMQLGGQPEIAAYRGEEAFTSALVGLTQGEKPRVLFTTGHGEMALDDFSDGGLAAARDLLGPDNVEIEEWRSLGAEAVPEGTDLVVVAGPQSAFLEPELALLDGYLAAGGRLLMLVDPVFARGAGTTALADLGLGDWLAGWGIRLGDDVVVDPAATLLGFGAETFFAADWTPHPVTRVLGEGEVPVLLRQARSVAAGSAPEGLVATELLRTTVDGWGLTRFDDPDVSGPAGDEVRGPVPLLVAVAPPGPASRAAADGTTDQENAPRLVVLGDSEIATAAFLDTDTGNRVLLNNLFNWLVERETLLGIPAKRPEQVRLAMTPREYRLSVVLALLVLPGLAIAAGLLVWGRRRRSG